MRVYYFRVPRFIRKILLKLIGLGVACYSFSVRETICQRVCSVGLMMGAHVL